MRNRFKGLDLIDRVPDRVPDGQRFVTFYRRQGSKPPPRKKKKCKKAKWLSKEDLQIAVKRKDVRSKGEKER